MVNASVSAYPVGPYVNDEGFHMVWMWRDTKYANTTYNLSYARSIDLKTWENCNNKTSVPIENNKIFTVLYGKESRLGQSFYSGLLNSRQDISFFKGKVVLTYIVNDDTGTQIVNSILENCHWESNVITRNCEYLDTAKLGTIKDVGRLKFSKIMFKKGGAFQYIRNKLKQCAKNIPSEGVYNYDDNLNLLNIEKRKNVSKKNVESKLFTKHLNVLKVIKLNNTYLSWAAKQNNGDKIPQCIIRKTCSENDFLSSVTLGTGSNSKYLRNLNGKKLKVWGGSQASFSAYYKNDTLYFSHYNQNRELTLSKIRNNIVESTIILDEANNEWDSHNNIEVIHHKNLTWIVGNVHNNQLKIYIFDGVNLINTLIEPPTSKYTYPKFIQHEEKLLLMARQGESGDGEYWILELSNIKLISRWKLFGAD